MHSYLICFLSALYLLCHGEDCGVYIRESQFSKKRKQALNGETPDTKAHQKYVIAQELVEVVGRCSGVVLMAPPDDSAEARATIATLLSSLKSKQKVSILQCMLMASCDPFSQLLPCASQPLSRRVVISAK